jgi:hypothetical protein
MTAESNLMVAELELEQKNKIIKTLEAENKKMKAGLKRKKTGLKRMKADLVEEGPPVVTTDVASQWEADCKVRQEENKALWLRVCIL